MNRIDEFFQHPDIVKKLVDSFPHGLLLIDDQGRIRASNKISATILGTKQAIIGKLIGEALGCLIAHEHRGECGPTEYCKGCEVRNLVLSAIGQNQAKKARTSLQLVNNHQVKDADIIISAVPFSFKNKRFGILVIEDIPGLSAVTQPNIQKGFSGIVGQHPKIKELFQTIMQVAPTEIPVLLQGETGTGKELVAQAIHESSSRSRKYFVPVNCGAMPEGLLESEFFGYVKGAFTGAIGDKKGRFELADGGTLFLDEIGEMSPSMQVKLLRVLQDGKFQPVGSERTLRVDVRIISATNKDLEKEVASGRFRKDLYYRLGAMPITLLPLRERKSDIPIIARHFLEKYGKAFFGKNATLSSDTVSMFMAYDWPGNVRELQNAIQFALTKCMGQTIEPSHLPQTIRFSVNKPFFVRHRQSALRSADVVKALKKSDGNKMKAAELLGVSRSTLYRFFARQEQDQLEW